MTDHSRHLKRFLKNRKGYSGIIATIFLVLVVLFLFFNVFMFMAQRNADLQDTIGQAQQMDMDTKNEKLLISEAEISANNDQVSVDCKISNTGALTSQLVRLWVQSTIDSEAVSEVLNPAITIQLGETIAYSDSIAVSGASPSRENNFWFVTGRGNIVSATDSIAFQQEIARKIGSILLDWGDFRYYDLLSADGKSNVQLPDPVFDFTLPKSHAILLGIQIRNLDPDGRSITLTADSFAVLQGTTIDKDGNMKKADPYFSKICEVTSNTYTPGVFAPLTLDLNVPTIIYFFIPKEKTNLYSADLSIVLQGYTENSDFSETIPFGALEFSSSMKQLYYETGGAQTLVAGQTSDLIQVVRRLVTSPDPGGITPIVTGTLTVTLSGQAGGKFYSDHEGTHPITSIIIRDGTSFATFYYRDSKVEKPTLKASAGGYTPASTKFNIIAGTMTKLFFSKGASQTVDVNHESTNIKVQIRNQYDAPIKTSTPLTVTLSTTSSGGTFQHGTLITINSGQSESGDFWYKDTVRGTPTLTASSGSLTPATTVFTIR